MEKAVENMKGVVEAFSEKTKGIMILGKWYNPTKVVAEYLANNAPKVGESVTLKLNDKGLVMFYSRTQGAAGEEKSWAKPTESTKEELFNPTDKAKELAVMWKACLVEVLANVKDVKLAGYTPDSMLEFIGHATNTLFIQSQPPKYGRR